MKGRVVFLIVMLSFMLLSCSKETDQKTYVSKNDVTSVIESLAASNGTKSTVVLDVPAPKVQTSQTRKVDVDLTTMSASVVYSAVYDMITNPGSYIGQTVKMSGTMATYHDTNTGKRYFACVIRDATACCAQGMEFVLKDSYKYPDDYPEPGVEVSVIGVFDIYSEGQYQYCTLRNAELV